MIAWYTLLGVVGTFLATKAFALTLVQGVVVGIGFGMLAAIGAKP